MLGEMFGCQFTSTYWNVHSYYSNEASSRLHRVCVCVCVGNREWNGQSATYNEEYADMHFSYEFHDGDAAVIVE